MAKKKEKFPQRVYVEREYDTGDDSSWLNAKETIEGIVDQGETKTIAIYVLESVKVVKASLNVTMKDA